jgi:hypothetical protein
VQASNILTAALSALAGKSATLLIWDRCAAPKLASAPYRCAETNASAERAQNFEFRLRAERRLGQLMKEMPKATNNVGYRWEDTGVLETPVLPPTLASQGIDKKLAKQARTECCG